MQYPQYYMDMLHDLSHTLLSLSILGWMFIGYKWLPTRPYWASQVPVVTVNRKVGPWLVEDVKEEPPIALSSDPSARTMDQGSSPY